MTTAIHSFVNCCIVQLLMIYFLYLEYWCIHTIIVNILVHCVLIDIVSILSYDHLHHHIIWKWCVCRHV